MEELERRLRSRNTDSDEVIAARMERAANEISHWDGYDYVLINDHVEGCFDEVRAILPAERLKRRRQLGLIGFSRGLMREVPDVDRQLSRIRRGEGAGLCEGRAPRSAGRSVGK